MHPNSKHVYIKIKSLIDFSGIPDPFSFWQDWIIIDSEIIEILRFNHWLPFLINLINFFSFLSFCLPTFWLAFCNLISHSLFYKILRCLRRRVLPKKHLRNLIFITPLRYWHFNNILNLELLFIFQSHQSADGRQLLTAGSRYIFMVIKYNKLMVILKFKTWTRHSHLLFFIKISFIFLDFILGFWC